VTALAWHYTTGHKLRLIEASGELQPSTASAIGAELPVLWFSRLERYEPTATKVIQRPGEPLRRLSIAETHAICGGLFRFAVPASRLISWPELARLARIDKAAMRSMERVGERQGAYPRLWMGTLDTIPLGDVVAVETLDARGFVSAAVD
jgi:hypothetical protein